MNANATLLSELSSRVESLRIGDERRIEPRVVTNIPAKVKGLNPLTSVGPSHPATVIEVSQRGLGLLVDSEHLPGASVQVFVAKEFFVGKVLHCTPLGERFIIGIELKNGIMTAS